MKNGNVYTLNLQGSVGHHILTYSLTLVRTTQFDINFLINYVKRKRVQNSEAEARMTLRFVSHLRALHSKEVYNN